AKWRTIRNVRRVVTGALEIERAQKRIGSSLEASPMVYISDENIFETMMDVDLAELCITSNAMLTNDEAPADAFRLPDVPGVAVVVRLRAAPKCARSGKTTRRAGGDPQYPAATPRAARARREWEAMRRAAE